MEALKDRLHPETLKYFEVSTKLKAKPYPEYESVQEVRQVRTQNMIYMLEDIKDYKGKVLEVRVPSEEVSEGILTTVYQPEDLADVPCIMIYFHGGGYVVGTRTDMDPMCKYVAMKAKCVIVNVEYRLSPEFKFPAHQNDAEAVTRWVMDNRVRLGGKPESSVGVAGDSGGGKLSACVAHDIQGLAFQVLIYPRVTHRLDFPSAKEFENGPVLTVNLIQWFETQSHENEADKMNPKGNALHREMFDHLPPALFIVAEIDPLRDESYAYQKKLEEAGVKCDLLEIKGVTHAFFGLNGIFKETTKEAYDRIINFLGQF